MALAVLSGLSAILFATEHLKPGKLTYQLSSKVTVFVRMNPSPTLLAITCALVCILACAALWQRNARLAFAAFALWPAALLTLVLGGFPRPPIRTRCARWRRGSPA